MANMETGKTFFPEITEEERKEKLEGWKMAVKCAAGWACNN